MADADNVVEEHRWDDRICGDSLPHRSILVVCDRRYVPGGVL